MTGKKALDIMINTCYYQAPYCFIGNYSKEIKAIKHDLNKFEKLTKKEIPVKPIAHHYEEVGEKPYIKYSCPKCNSKYQLIENIGKYCPYCGQRLDWSDCNE